MVQKFYTQLLSTASVFCNELARCAIRGSMREVEEQQT
jgi:hypothetical protein